MSHPILLYDGVCGLCNRLVQFILKLDRGRIFRFASLQSPFAGRILSRHGANAADLDTVYVVVDHNGADELLLPRSEAVLFILSRLGGVWRAIAFLFRIVSRPLRNWGYGVVARNRYRVFGRYDACPVPSEDTRSRFLDL